MKAVILAGGKGTRLGLTDIPKPMVTVDGKPLLHRLIEQCRQFGFDEIVMLSGHLGQVIEEYFGNGSRFGVRITHVIEFAPLGTAGAFAQIASDLREPFLVLYGDILIDVDLKHFAEFALSRGGEGSLFVHPNDHPHDSDLVEVDETGRIVNFLPKPHESGVSLPNLVSAAIYVLNPSALHFIPEGAADWGKDVFPAMARDGALYAYKSLEYAKDIGTPHRLKKAEASLRDGTVARLSRRARKGAVFLDRDGVINEERDGILKPQQLILIDGAASAIKRLNSSGVPAICVTNQPSIAKGNLSWDGLKHVHNRLDTLLADACGAYIDDMFVCPHHEEKGWPGEVKELKIDCDCRKPKPGLLVTAASFHNIDLEKSWMVGDRYCDLAAGSAVGAKTILVKTGHNGSDRSKFSMTPDYIADDIAVAVQIILELLD